MPAAQVDAMLAAPPLRCPYAPKLAPIVKLLRELGSRSGVGSVRIEKPDFTLELIRRS